MLKVTITTSCCLTGLADSKSFGFWIVDRGVSTRAAVKWVSPGAVDALSCTYLAATSRTSLSNVTFVSPKVAGVAAFPPVRHTHSDNIRITEGG